MDHGSGLTSGMPTSVPSGGQKWALPRAITGEIGRVVG